MEKNKLLPVILAYIGVVIIWSTTPLAIKWSGEGVGFIFGVAARMVIGATLVLLLTIIWYRRLPLHSKALQVYSVAGIAIFGSMMAVYWGAQYIPSGLISVIFGLTPIITSWLATRFLLETSFTGLKILGAVTGILGLVIIFSEQINIGEQAPWGIGAVLVSVILHSISSVGIKKINANLPALIVTSGGLLLSLPFFIVTFLLMPGALPDEYPLRAIWSIVYLGIMGSAVGFVSYYFLLQNLNASTVALITLITPVTALWLGHLFNNEPISLYVWSGTGLVLLGLGLHQWGGLLFRFIWRKNKSFCG